MDDRLATWPRCQRSMVSVEYLPLFSSRVGEFQSNRVITRDIEALKTNSYIKIHLFGQKQRQLSGIFGIILLTLCEWRISWLHKMSCTRNYQLSVMLKRKRMLKVTLEGELAVPASLTKLGNVLGDLVSSTYGIEKQRLRWGTRWPCCSIAW